jgi:hypothetical protein
VGRIQRFSAFGAVLIFGGISGLSQQAGTPVKTESLYSVALFSSIAEMEKSWGSIDDSKILNQVRTDYRHMLVEQDENITRGLPTEKGDFHVEYLDDRGMIDRYAKVHKEFAIIRIFPIENDGARLKITINVYYFTYRRHKKMFGLSDWSEVEFRFDCDTQKFVVASVKLGGI